MSIQVENITKYYGAQKALDDVSFKINKGEVVGFLGPNGAGKSTMMRILTTYLSASEGTAIVNGFDVQTAQRDVQRSIGYLPEQNPLYPDMFIKEYLRFTAGLYKLDNVESRIARVIKATGLSSHQSKKAKELSKGYRQRLGLAAALLHDPAVLILDEPTTGLDPNQLVEIRQLIKNIGKSTTVLLSTHIMQEVEAMCDRVIIINKGQIVADKNLTDLVTDDAQIIEVEFDFKVEYELLEQIEMVREIEEVPSPQHKYRLIFYTKNDMRSAVFDLAHDKGLKILGLVKRNKNLESLFRELTGESTK
jgi:ABC-2 type transport system ATP-binding protein